MLLTDSFGGLGGISTYNRELVTALSNSADIEAITIMQRLAPRGARVLPPKVQLYQAAAGGLAAFALAIGKLMMPLKPIDHVHCGHINLAPFAAALSAARGVPWSLSIHGIEAWQRPTRRLVPYSLRSAAFICPVSAYTAERFLGWSGVDQSRIKILPNTIHLEQFGTAPMRRDLALRYGTAGRRVLMTFGRLVDEKRAKGFDPVLEVLPLVLQRHPDLVYLIVGEGPDRHRLEAKAFRLGVADAVRFTGKIDEDEKGDVLRLADLFVMPSKGEGFGIVLLEAMACGIPVVASSADGSREALLNGRLGQLVDPDDLAKLADAIERGLGQAKGVPSELAQFAFPAFSHRARSIFGLR